MVKKKTVYRSPQILREVSVETEAPILGGSIVDNLTEISTTGQEVNEVIDVRTDGFNHSWR